MQKACQEIKDDPTNLKTDDGMTKCRIHIDGSWQIFQMRKAISAILWHCVETDKGDENRHQFCPPG